jgi:hypothetical protein
MSPKRMGRPPKPPKPGEMAPLSVRITAGLKARVQAAAEANGRSFGAEVESRLEDSFNKDTAEAMMEEVRTIRVTTFQQIKEIQEQLQESTFKAAADAVQQALRGEK